MTKFLELKDLAAEIPEGAALGIGGVHFARVPIALIQALLSTGKKDFTFISWGGGLPLEMFLEACAVKKLIFAFSSLDVFGLAPRFRKALEEDRIEVEEWTALAMIQGLHAAWMRLPEMPFQVPLGSDMMSRGVFWRTTASPISPSPVAYATALRIDSLLLHAQRADRAGNIEIEGARGLDVSMAGAASQIFVTVEEIVETGSLGRAKNSFVLPKEFVTAVACVPFGAYPTSCLPCYTTDYRQLQKFSETSPDRAIVSSRPGDARAGRIEFIAREDCRDMLTSTAKISVSELRNEVSDWKQPAPPAIDCTPEEFLTAALSREYDSSSVCSVGSVSPLATISYLLAKRTHAPDLTLIAFNGGFIDVDVHAISMSLGESLDFQTAKVFWGGDDTYHWYYQQGRITHEVIPVAQVDVHGRTNNAWIENAGKRVRLPGQGGMADVANLHQNFVLYLTRHTPERFADSVKFCTASRGLLHDDERRKAGLQPGNVRLLTNLGVFQLDVDAMRFRLMSLHPGISVEHIREQTGGEFLVEDTLPVTPAPSAEDLRLIREEIDPFGLRRLEFTSGRQRREILTSILDSEESAIRNISLKG
ncbi:MAG: CoA-transferase [Acidobacteriota bacterium]|nr:CoA-transferase [Acidobacteriota bacterium]